jgi:chemotaxis protein MotB
MALARARRGDSGMNYWPGFVDALSTLILGIIFLLTVFVVVQFYLQQEVASKNTALTRLDAQVAQLTELLAMEKSSKAKLEDQLIQLHASLATAQSEGDRFKAAADSARAAATAAQDKVTALSAERDRLQAAADSAGAAATAAQGKATALSGQLEGEKKISADALAQVEVLNQQIAALRSQLAALEQTLDAAEKKNEESQGRITELGQRLNLALAERVNELKRYRSDFFGKLREILGDRPDIRVVGDRFVFQSELFFDSGRADLKPAGRLELDKLAGALLALEQTIPADIPWVLRVDGHTDVRPIAGLFKSNWDLSAGRAIAVVQYLVAKGVSPQRLVAAGFGEFQPIDPGNTEDAYRRNRRIEFKLTER